MFFYNDYHFFPGKVEKYSIIHCLELQLSINFFCTWITILYLNLQDYKNDYKILKIMTTI